MPTARVRPLWCLTPDVVGCVYSCVMMGPSMDLWVLFLPGNAILPRSCGVGPTSAAAHRGALGSPRASRTLPGQTRQAVTTGFPGWLSMRKFSARRGRRRSVRKITGTRRTRPGSQCGRPGADGRCCNR